MKFNKGNYELYVIDFLEGKLKEEDHYLFSKFLKDNPDIYKEVREIRNIQLRSDEVKFHEKDILKKTIRISEYNRDFENFCIAYIEGDLEAEEKSKFENWLKENPVKKDEFESFRKVYLKADMNIIFSPKSRLKRLSIVQKRTRWISVLSAAAAISIFIIIFIRSADIINRNIISEEINIESATGNESLTEEPEQIEMKTDEFPEQQLTENQLADEEKSGNIKIIDLHLSSEQNITSLNTSMGHGAWSMEKIMIKPVPSRLACIEIHHSVNYNELKQPVPGKSRNFNEYKTIREFASEDILAGFFSANASDGLAGITFWELASDGFEGLNNISDGGYALNRETDRDGTLKRISVETPLFGISIPIKNKQPQ